MMGGRIPSVFLRGGGSPGPGVNPLKNPAGCDKIKSVDFRFSIF